MVKMMDEIEISKNESIGDNEAALYDRQIRLWGLDAQNRLRNSSALIAGLSNLGAEVAKNLTLAGLKRLTLLDHDNVCEKDNSQFLIPANSIDRNRAAASRERIEQLNPMVEVKIDEDMLDKKEEDFFKQFDLIFLANQSYDTIDKIDEICRRLNIKLCVAGVFGWFGYGFSNFLHHEYIDDTKIDSTLATSFVELGNNEGSSSKRMKLGPKTMQETTHFVRKFMSFPSWSKTMNVDWLIKPNIGKARKLLPHSYFIIAAILKSQTNKSAIVDESHRKNVIITWKNEIERCKLDVDGQKYKPEQFIDLLLGELTPVAAIIGGVMAQEVIKAMSQKDAPLHNLFLYSPLESNGIVCRLPPESE